MSTAQRETQAQRDLARSQVAVKMVASVVIALAIGAVANAVLLWMGL